MADGLKFSEDGKTFTVENGEGKIEGDTEAAKQIMRGLVHFLRDKGLNCAVSDGHVVFTHLPR